MPKILCATKPTIPVEVYQKSADEEFMEKLWAFKRIKNLIKMYKEKDCDEEDVRETLDENEEVEKKTPCYDKAVELAKRYNFVTEVTSMVVEANEHYQNQTIGYEKVNQGRFMDNDYGFGPNGGFRNKFASFQPQPPTSSSPPPSPPPSFQNFQGFDFDLGVTLSPIDFQQFFDVSDVLFEDTQQDHYYDTIITPLSADHGNNNFNWFPPPPPVTTTTTTTTQCSSGTMTLYSKTYFRGESLAITEEFVFSLADYGFDNKVQSIDIKGCFCWKVYENPTFSGKFILLTPNEYQSAVDIKDIFKKASSVIRTDC